VQLFDLAYEKSYISVNDMFTERLCLIRWLAMQDAFASNDIPQGQHLLMQDWDTVITHNNLGLHLQDINHTYMIGNFHMPGDNHAREQCETWPIWTICPNIILFQKKVLSEYLLAYKAHLQACFKRGRSVYRRTFCDMGPWSSVLSRYLLLRDNSLTSIIEFNNYLDSTGLVAEHNLANPNEKNHSFEVETTCLESAGSSFTHKKVLFDQAGIPYLHSLSTDSFLRPISLHYSGVLGKHLLVSRHFNILLKLIQGP
jgi:hypothetical protein